MVDDRIRSIIEKDTYDNQLKRDARFTYRYAIALSCTRGSMASSTLFFRICILIVCLFALGWLAGRFVWTSIAACVIMLLPLIESRAGIIHVFKKIAGASASIGQGRREIPLQQNDSNLRNAYEGHGILQSKKILFAVDGFLASLRAKLYKYFIHL